MNSLFWVRTAPILLSTSSLAKGTGAILQWLAASTGATAIFAGPDVTQRRSIAFQYASWREFSAIAPPKGEAA